MRSSAQLSICGPGTRIMQGQTATRRADGLSSYRTANTPMTPASNPAPNGCRKTFALYCATLRRRIAPAAALKNINTAADGCCTPKITAKATAPPRRCEREEPCRRRRRLRNRPDHLDRATGRNPTGADPLYRLHSGSDAIHVHAARIDRQCGDQLGVLVIGLKLQLSPTWEDPRTQSKSVAELRRRS